MAVVVATGCGAGAGCGAAVGAAGVVRDEGKATEDDESGKDNETGCLGGASFTGATLAFFGGAGRRISKDSSSGRSRLVADFASAGDGGTRVAGGLLLDFAGAAVGTGFGGSP